MNPSVDFTNCNSVYSPYRLLFARNLGVAFVNGLVTLVILLIAPMGLAAVVVNTLLVALSTMTVGVCGDLVVRWLLQGTTQSLFSPVPPSTSLINQTHSQELDRKNQS